MGPAVGGILADTMGLRAPFTFTGIAAALAALYGLIRLPETRRFRQQESADFAPEAEISAVVRNNAVPAALAGTSLKLKIPEEAVLVPNAARQQLPAGTCEDRRNANQYVSALAALSHQPFAVRHKSIHNGIRYILNLTAPYWGF